MHFTRDLSTISTGDRSIAGGKAASLGTMIQAGIPVPPGFVILTTAFEHFIHTSGLTDTFQRMIRLLSKQQDSAQRTELSIEIYQRILDAPFPADLEELIVGEYQRLGYPFVAVRSSATAEDSTSAAWAGQLRSHLNIDQQYLIAKITDCYASLFTPHALVYWAQRAGKSSPMAIAVVVQQMINSEQSGTAFSLHPVTENRGQLLVEAVWGLGEAIGSGQVTPDSYVIDKNHYGLLEVRTSTHPRAVRSASEGGTRSVPVSPSRIGQRILTDVQLHTLGELLVAVENLFQCPQEIEWAYEGDALHVLQSRPVTTPKTAPAIKAGARNTELDEQFSRLTILSGGGRSAYYYSHYSIAHLYSSRHDLWPLDIPSVASFKDHYVRWHTVPKDAESFDPYLNRFLEDPSLIQQLRAFVTNARESFLSTFRESTVHELQNEELEEIICRYYDSFQALLRTAGTLRCVDRAIVSRLRTIFAGSPNIDELIRLASVTTTPSFATREDQALLRLALRIQRDHLDLTSDDVSDAVQSLWSRYCWISCGYYDEPARTTTDYEAVLHEHLRRDPSQMLSDKEGLFRQDLALREEYLTLISPPARIVTNIARSSAELKDYFKFSINEIVFRSSTLFDEISRRTGEHTVSIKDLSPAETQLLLRGREIDWEIPRRRLDHSVIISGPGQFTELVGIEASRFEARHLVPRISAGRTFHGRAASPGYAWGRAKVVLMRTDIDKVRDGDIVVASNVTPDLMAVLRRNVGIIAEEGGITSHAAVLSREFGLPCIVGIPSVTALIRDGDLVELDADRSIVNIIERS